VPDRGSLPSPVPPVAFLTGAGSGIGRATALLLAESGYHLALVGRRANRLAETAGLLPKDAPEHIQIAADIGRADQAHIALARCLAKWPRLDALINNAGLAPMHPIDAHTPALIDEVYRINALAPAYLIAKAWPALTGAIARRGEAPAQQCPSPCIINIATQGIDDPYPGFFAYAAAKAAAAVMIKSAAKEGAPFGIRAFAIAPGAVETEMFRALIPESQVPRSDTLDPAVVAQAILACLRGDHDAHNGEVIRLKGP
jgi:NAD(P)-dependent dehydrogenase (short-subunit alcohol dehydrogenase family)